MKKLLIFMMFVFMAASFAADSNSPENKSEKMKPVLLVVDIQNEYLKYSPDEEKKISLMMINASIQLFREYDFPIILVYHTDPKWGPKPGTEPFEFPSSIAVQDEDSKIIKNYPSAFKKTELEKLLQEKDCNTLFLCGLSAVGCVLATYHSAMDKDYDVFMLKEALLSHKAEYTDFIEDIFDAVGYKALEVMLKNAEQ